MRIIEIKHPFRLDRDFAEKFINEWHRNTKKKLPHLISLTFSSGDLAEKQKEIDYIIDLLYQACIIQNPIDKMIVNVDWRKKTYLTLEIS